MNNVVPDLSIAEFMTLHPYVVDFFTTIGMENVSRNLTIHEWLRGLSDELLEQAGFDREQVINYLTVLTQKLGSLEIESKKELKSLTVLGGYDKSKTAETVGFTLKPGEIICLVGPTGSGKSRLLADIECLAQRDTPTGRQVLINGGVPKAKQRFGLEQKLVAQISQNMNFVVDLPVREFLIMHAKSRMVPDLQETVCQVIDCANDLTGEKFSPDISLTQLSGGQSRALMIADTALLSVSPVILIDEIENAGVDRKNALRLLVKKEKIVLISTHDPLLAFMGNRRIVIKNGGIAGIIESSPQERMNLKRLERLDGELMELRGRLRSGEKVEELLAFG